MDLPEGILDIPEAASRFGRAYHVKGKTFPNTMIDLLQWQSGLEVVSQILGVFNNTPSDERPMTYDKSSVSFAAPIPSPGKIVALGLNYRAHIRETGKDIPEFPVVFAKFSSAVIGPGDEIKIPEVSNKIDWEVELGVVIGKYCTDVSEADALDYVAGYTIINDVTARDLQKKDVQWIRGKSLDTFCPMGPCIVTTDELNDGSGLAMSTKINGEVKQNSSTSDLLYDVPKIIAYLSKSFTLEPGDVIATGTPSGVGFARDPPEYLNPGDTVELEIQCIGVLKNTVV
ncbi:MAG: fumarylacetoacetate hydrolase family protein [Candidatus Thorarchaeota archaeon]